MLTRKQSDFEKSLLAQEEKVRGLSEQADQLIVDENHMKNEIRSKRNDIQDRFERLKQKSESRNVDLLDQFKFYTFERNCEEMLVWLSEKIKLAKTTEYLEPANLQSKLQKHTTFEAEVMRQEPRVNALCESGDQLIRELPQQKPRIEDLVGQLQAHWNELYSAARLKGQRLRQAVEAQLFFRSLADLDIWLNESEHTVSSQDLGRDLAATVVLRRRLVDVENEWITKRARVNELVQEMERMIRDDHFDAEHLSESGLAIRKRFSGLEEPIRVRKERLDEVVKTHEMRRELADEDQWIWEKDLALNARKKIPTGKEF